VAFGTELRTDPVFWIAKDSPARPASVPFPARTTSPAITAPADAAPVMSSTRMIVHPNIGLVLRSTVMWADRDFRSHHPRNESGHPIRHQFTRSIPSSQCIVCHIHPGTNMVSTYFGYTWWDNEMGWRTYVAGGAASSTRTSKAKHRRGIRGFGVRGLCRIPPFWKDWNSEFNQQRSTPRSQTSQLRRPHCSPSISLSHQV